MTFRVIAFLWVFIGGIRIGRMSTDPEERLAQTNFERFARMLYLGLLLAPALIFFDGIDWLAQKPPPK